MWDGVHVLLKDRSEIGKFFIPDIKNSRKNDSEYIYSDYTPTHLHHNWRYSNIYEEAAKYESDPNYNPGKWTNQWIIQKPTQIIIYEFRYYN